MMQAQLEVYADSAYNAAMATDLLSLGKRIKAEREAQGLTSAIFRRARILNRLAFPSWKAANRIPAWKHWSGYARHLAKVSPGCWYKRKCLNHLKE